MYKDLIKGKELYSLDFPKTIVPIPTNIDYENGFIDRYFTQKVNEKNGFVFELDSNEYINLIQNPYWILHKMTWRISGPINPVYSTNGMITDIGVISSNSASISITSTKIKNIGLYLPNLLQFHK
jgi:hypothetical protein